MGTAKFNEIKYIDTLEKQIELKNFLKNSSRVIFSAKFGDDKTLFLKEITQSVEFKKYQCFTIYFVIFVTAENADTFEYVKRDILLQLTDGTINGW